MILLVAEKPSVAKEYAELLRTCEGETFTPRDGYLQGSRHAISWCVGHLLQFAKPEAYGWTKWSLDELPMVPTNWIPEPIERTRKQLMTLVNLMNRAETIINGADAGREGELIFGLVLASAGIRGKKIERLWLNSFVQADMVKAWKARRPSHEYQSLFESALGRAKADWLLGMNASRGYAISTGVKGLSVGRVQTPTLALVVARDLQIQGWKDRFFFVLEAFWHGLRFTYEHAGEKEFASVDALTAVVEACAGKLATLVDLVHKESRQNPPKPFDLAELQKVANKNLGLTASETLEAAQSLYEAKHITYPRTDSQYLPESMQAEAWALANKLADETYRAQFCADGTRLSFFNSSKVTDHFAIIPTGIEAGLDGLTEKERKVYQIVKRRFLFSFMRPYVFDAYALRIECQGYQFVANARYEKDLGFKSLLAENTADEELKNRIPQPLQVRVGETGDLNGLETIKKKATKPEHYTEATLITAMETAGKSIENEELREAMKERGLGTPATKASIIEGLKAKEYIIAKGKNLLSTPKGRELVDLVDSAIKTPETTGEWEFQLKQIAKGEISHDAFMSGITDYIKGLSATFGSEKASSFSERVDSNKPDCPGCKKAKLRENSHGLFCQSDCGFKLWATQFKKKLTKKQMSDLILKGETGIIKGFESKRGNDFDAKLILKEGKVSLLFA